jgi:ABC-2 type transport system ATP-binding protein
MTMPILCLENLTKVYDVASSKGAPSQAVLAADRLNLSVQGGEIFGLIGPNGAGKTTTLKMVCGLLEPTAGHVIIDNYEVATHAETVQRYLGYLADFGALYDDLKVCEYLEYFACAYKLAPSRIPGRIHELITLMGLEGKRDAMIGGLSRGMKQRLGIARAIIHDPSLLALDEPAAGLDPKARFELKKLLKELNAQGKTVLITSHILSDLEEICTSVAILEKGRLVRCSPLQEILSGAAPGAAAGAAARTIRIRLASPGFDLAGWLEGRPGISGVVPEVNGAHFAFSGGETDLGELVKALSAAGVLVTGVESTAQTLEEAYSRITKGEVM